MKLTDCICFVLAFCHGTLSRKCQTAGVLSPQLNKTLFFFFGVPPTLSPSCLYIYAKEHSVLQLINVKEHIVKQGEKSKSYDMLDFSLGCGMVFQKPHHCSIMSHYKACLSFPTFIFRPNAGNLWAMTKLCEKSA